MRRLALQFFFCLIAVCFASQVQALSVPARPEGYVSDWAKLLSPAGKVALSERLARFESESGTQIVVATFPSLDGESLEDFSVRLAEAWKIGRAGRDDGVIFLVFREDRKMRIEVGYGLEGVLPDALAGLIVQDVASYFREGNGEEGIFFGVASVMRAVSGEETGDGAQVGGRRALSDEDLRRLGKNVDVWLGFLLAALFVLFLIDVIRYSRYRRGHGSYAGRYGFSEWFLRFAVLLFVLKIFFQLLFYVLLMSRGGYYGSRSGMGGFSGGGGGRFGGGGASGSW